MAINFSQEEEAVLAKWREIGAFERLQELSKDKPPYTFYDGPPFATGLPHYGHLLVSTIKDCVCRYWAMNGYRVSRRFGWDTHGLPIEYEIDKKLGMSGREAVEKMGIAQYNAECKSIVMRYAAEWREMIERLGRWVDFDNDYKTMDPQFMESVWWVFKRLFDKQAVYRGYKVMPYSTALATPLSNFETAQNYKDRQDPTVIVTFPLIDDPNTNLLAWTTTPWTLPMNLGICVNPDLEYVKVEDKKTGKVYILLEGSLGMLYTDKETKAGAYKIVGKHKGSDMKGWKYEPLFSYFVDKFAETAYRVLCDTYVVAGEGVGLVHQAPAYGEDDYNVAKKAGIISETVLPPNPVDDHGIYTSEVTDFAGVHVKEAEKDIISYLKKAGRLVKASQIMHSYPHCPRSDTPLIYRAVSAWFVKIPPVIPTMLQNISDSHWVPGFVKEKRFANWIANAHDWNVSRNRYWGTPLPLWVSEDFQEVICVGSIQELRDLSGYTGEITDLHRDSIDHITIPSKTGKGELRRIPEVFDCWFESGSMPYASLHYPFEADSEEVFSKIFPADFITEGLDQTRGWFYTLVVLGAHLYGVSPFKNCIVNGIVLAEDGKKMSKRLKNYPDPSIIIKGYGVDALRLYMINSPVVRAESLRFKEAGVKEVVAKVMLPIWNSYKFFEGQVLLLKKSEDIDFIYTPGMEAHEKNVNLMDHWILASCQSLVKQVHEEMAVYHLYAVVPRLLAHIENITNWYIRFNRDRLKGHGGKNETIHALNTLFEVLYISIRALAPFAPFITDKIFGHLVPFLPPNLQPEDARSVHFQAFPTVQEEYMDTTVERRVSRMQTIIELGRVSRERRNIGLKTPLKSIVVIHSDPEYLDDVRLLETYILQELNIRELKTTSDGDSYGVEYSVNADWPTLGKRLKKDAKIVRDGLSTITKEQIAEIQEGKGIVVKGVQLEPGELVIRRSLKAGSAPNLETNSDGQVLLILDVAMDEDLQLEGLTREVVNRVQRLRKKAGLVATDDVKMEYKVLADPKAIGIDKVFTTRGDALTKILRRPVEEYPQTEAAAPGESLILEEEQEVSQATFMLRLCKL